MTGGPQAARPPGASATLRTHLSALARHPEHIGLNHYLIHATDADVVAQRALAAADRLGALAAQLKAQGFEVSKDWRNHDQHFLWFAALMEGRGDEAVLAARSVAERAGAADHLFGEYRRSLPMLALLRLQRWEALLAEAKPAGRLGLAQTLGEHARGVAYARTGRLREARAALLLADAGAALVIQANPSNQGFARTLRDVVTAATDRLRAEIASAEGRHDVALALQAQALAASQRADQSEPPMLAAGDRLALGEMQLRAGRAAQAEQTFRQDLAARPGSGWALDGLARSLKAQRKTMELQAVQPQLARAWPLADASLRGKD